MWNNAITDVKNVQKTVKNRLKQTTNLGKVHNI